MILSLVYAVYIAKHLCYVFDEESLHIKFLEVNLTLGFHKVFK